MREEGATVLALVPAMLQLLMDAADASAEVRREAAAAAALVEHVLIGGQVGTYPYPYPYPYP